MIESGKFSQRFILRNFLLFNPKLNFDHQRESGKSVEITSHKICTQRFAESQSIVHASRPFSTSASVKPGFNISGRIVVQTSQPVVDCGSKFTRQITKNSVIIQYIKFP